MEFYTQEEVEQKVREYHSFMNYVIDVLKEYFTARGEYRGLYEESVYVEGDTVYGIYEEWYSDSWETLTYKMPVKTLYSPNFIQEIKLENAKKIEQEKIEAERKAELLKIETEQREKALLIELQKKYGVN